MKLAKFQKEAIVRAIMNDVPDVPKRTFDEVQAVFVKAMSKECRAAYKKIPKALKTETCWGKNIGLEYGHHRFVVGDADTSEVMKTLQQAYDDRCAVEKKLTDAVMSCTTLKQLNTLLPEFKKHFPTETQPTKNLPAVANLVADMTKLGWPKGATK